MKNAKYVKDHVSSYGKDLKQATNKKFGINSALIIRAVNGDEKALTQIGDLGNTGERLTRALPAIKQNLEQYISGIERYNLTLADLYKQGGKAAANIDKAGGDLALENTRYLNQIEEYVAKLTIGLEKEAQRHGDAMDLMKLQAWIDAQMVEVNTKAQFESATNRPMLWQIQADRDYEAKKAEHLLNYGSEGDLSLIPKKHFATNPIVNAWNKVRQIFS